MSLCVSYGYVVRTGIPIGWNYGVWYGVTSSLENVKKFCESVDVNQEFPMSMNTYAKVQSCRVLLSRNEAEYNSLVNEKKKEGKINQIDETK